MIKNNSAEKLIYPILILAIVLVCTLLIFLELWSNVSDLLPPDMTKWIKNFASDIKKVEKDIDSYFSGFFGEKIPAGSFQYPQPPSSAEVLTVWVFGQSHA
jgi:hypothetical protein